jgi:hypothetical protein
MKRPRRAREGRATLVRALGLGLVAAVGVVAPVRAAAPHTFGMVGLARLQTAYLHAVLTRPPDPTHPGCRVTLSFVDAHGRLFRDRAGNEVKQTFVLRDNVSSTLRLRSSDALAAGESRTLMRGVVNYPADREGPSDCGSIMVVEEVADQNGHASVIESIGEPCPDAPNPPSPICPGALER